MFYITMFRNPFFILIIMMILTGSSAIAQLKFELQEFTGTIKSFEPGFVFAYETMKLDVSGKEESFRFWPVYGKLILTKFKPGDQVTIRVNINMTFKERAEANPKRIYHGHADDIAAIKIADAWVDLPKTTTVSRIRPGRIFFEYEVKEVVLSEKFQLGLLFDEGLLAHMWYNKAPIKKGDIVSFRGYLYNMHEGYMFPVPDVKQVVSFLRLHKQEGIIKSFLFKQNFVCVGMVVRTKNKELRLSFPSNYAERIQAFAGDKKRITFYHDEFKERANLLAGVHAIVFEGDTLEIQGAGFGNGDIKHDHKPVTIKGKITHVNKSDKGKIISVIVGNDCYVDVDHTMEKQLGNFFTKGQVIEVSGDERIKAQGEIYSKNYRIITPRSIAINGKSFLLGQQP